MFNSLKEICDEFNIDYTEDLDSIKKKLTDIQSSKHPDADPNNKNGVDDLYYRVSEAKEFIKKHYKNNQELVTISDLVDLIQVTNKKNELATIIKESETILENTYERNIKQVKSSFLPKKIAVGTMISVVTAICGFPTTLKQNPFISELIDNYSDEILYMMLFDIWLIVVVFSVMFLFKVLKRERQFKEILSQFKDNRFQYEVFSVFAQRIINKSSDTLTFFRSELEDFIFDKTLEKYKKYRNKKSKSITPNNVNVYIDELLPKLSEIIINRAIEQKIIVKSDEATWEDKYIIIAPEGF